MNTLMVSFILAGVAPKTGLGTPGDPATGLGDKSVPTTINYQAYITHAGDTTALDTTANFTFRIYDAPSGGNLLWTENQSSVQVIQGILDTRLGINTPLPPTIFYTGQTLWLEVVMGTETFSPRKALVSVGQAFHAQRADTADYAISGGSGDYIQNQIASAQTADFWINGIGRAGNTSGKYGELNNSSYGVYGQYNASNYGYLGGGSYGVYGHYDSNTYGYIAANNMGVYGQSSRTGVYGYVSSADADTGVKGLATGGGNDIGVYGEGYIGAYGNGSNYGVYGQGNTYGVYGCRGDSTYGILGYVGAGNDSMGVYAHGAHHGVYGRSNYCGVYGQGNIYGVEGYSDNGLAFCGRTNNANDTVMALFGPGGLSDAEFRFMTDGNAFADGSWTGGGADFAEMVDVKGTGYEPGDVLVIADGKRVLEKSSEPYSTKVMGVVSTQPGFVAGGGDEAKGDIPVAVVGIVPCKVTGEGGEIKAGDLLTTSSTPGYAMKAAPVDLGGIEIYRPGTILGKAMEDFSGTEGTILIYVNVK